MKNLTNKGLPHKMIKIMAIVLIVVGTILTIVDFRSLLEDYDSYVKTVIIVRIISQIMMIAGGLFIYFIRNRELRFIVGATGIIISVSDFTSSIMTLYENIVVTDNFVTLIFLVFFAMIPMTDLLLMIFSIRYIQGHRRNAMRMAINVCIPLAIFAIDTFAFVGLIPEAPEVMIPMFLTYGARVVLYAMFLWFLMLHGVREDLSEWKVYKLSEQVYRSTNTDPKATIYRGDLHKLLKKMENPDSWNESDTIPGAKEFHVIFGKDMFLKRMTFRIMDGSDNIRVSIINENSKEYIQATRFDLKEIAPIGGGYDVCRAVRIFGYDGFFININVRDDMPIPMKTYAIDRLIDRLSFKNDERE